MLIEIFLDAISGGEFSEALRSGIEFDKDGFAVVPFGSSKHDNHKALITGKFTVTLYKDEVYELADYDPNAWNYFPDVIPQEDVLMRVETEGGDKFRGYFHTFPDGVGRWCCVCFTPRHMPLHETEKVKRYRLWE